MIAAARRHPIALTCAVAVLAVALVAGCTRTVDSPLARPETVAAPISTLQVHDLLSPEVQDGEGNLFVSVDPDRCSGLAREVDPPFLATLRPMASAGGHWTTPDAAVYVEEMVAVYRYDFDSGAALENVRDTIQACRDTPLSVTTMRGRTYVFRAEPGAAEPPADSVLWSLRAADWNCDNAFVAAHNAAIEITACGAAAGFDAAPLATDARFRIEALANTTA
ncbi:sensor domain-containing protein [Mycobacterium sp. SMC-4]|uniref:sensor domain-containing protein n=1 Tax=Mycobacterium sp. SMC-4 TaxID=2857059 RepID=UPI0021B23AD0|nr:sensor domain-containing protein [Mycobacterium sp. SMC-4]